MEKQIKIYLKRYRQDLLPASLLLAAIILISRIVMPQLADIGNLRSDIENQETTNEGLRTSDTTLSSISEDQLDEDYELVTNALPLNKSIGAIFESLTRSALEANVVVGGLNVQVGPVYEADNTALNRNIEGVPFLNIIVRVAGQNATDFTRFAQVLYESAPVVEINSIETTDSDARYDVDFYFKPINTNAFQAQTAISPLNAQQQELLNTLRDWEL